MGYVTDRGWLYAWEAIMMLRKACIVIIAAATTDAYYQLTAAMMLLAMSLALQVNILYLLSD
jgi:hypothetical protein